MSKCHIVGNHMPQLKCYKVVRIPNILSIVKMIPLTRLHIIVVGELCNLIDFQAEIGVVGSAEYQDCLSTSEKHH